MSCGIDPQRDGDQIDHEDRPKIQFDRHRQPFDDLSPDRLIVLERFAKAERQEVLHPYRVLHMERFIETVLCAPLGHRLVHGATLFNGDTAARRCAETARCTQLGGITGR